MNGIVFFVKNYSVGINVNYSDVLSNNSWLS